LTKLFLGVIINLPNKLNNFQKQGRIFFFGDIYTLFRHNLLIGFEKMQIPYGDYGFAPVSIFSLFGDDWNLRFCATISVVALFVYQYL